MEIAFVSANKLRFELDKSNKKLSSKIISFFYNHSEQYLTTMLVGNNIALVIYGIEMAIVVQPWLQWIGQPLLISVVQSIIAAIIVLFTGEYLPKTIFKANANTWLTVLSPITYVFYFLLYPISVFATFLSSIILKTFKLYHPQKGGKVLSKADLDYLVNESLENGNTDDDVEHDVKIFQNALDFSSVKLRDCIIPRTEIVAVPFKGTSLETLKNTFVETGLSKILVYEDTIDEIVGYIHSLDLFHDAEHWKSHIRKMPIVPETMAAAKLMDIFIKQKKSIAVVVDEFGGTAGIVTFEDIIEEIFGEIEDEHDKPEFSAKQISKSEFILSGRLEIDRANYLFDLNLPESDNYMTIAGFILYRYQNFPKLNETITIDNWTFKVIQTNNNRIDLVKLTVLK